MANEFKVHILNQRGIQTAEDIAKAFDQLLSAIRDAARSEQQPAPNGREIALVQTKLQEASFWAKRAIAVLPQNWATGSNPDKPE